jgi:hypothetical protein
MKSIILYAVLLSGAIALPAPTKLTGEALEKELELLNAPEAWEKRSFCKYTRSAFLLQETITHLDMF